MVYRDIDPKTQCEIERHRSSLTASLLIPFINYYPRGCDVGLFNPPKRLKSNKYPPWYEITLKKSERSSMSYEEQQELKRYIWTLKKIRDREIWPGMIL